MSKLNINPGCIACGACQYIASEVFAVSNICRVKQHVDFKKYHCLIKEAVKQCPVSVIKYEYIISKKRSKKRV